LAAQQRRQQEELRDWRAEQARFEERQRREAEDAVRREAATRREATIRQEAMARFEERRRREAEDAVRREAATRRDATIRQEAMARLLADVGETAGQDARPLTARLDDARRAEARVYEARRHANYQDDHYQRMRQRNLEESARARAQQEERPGWGCAIM
jgi:hypothetical protein